MSQKYGILRVIGVSRVCQEDQGEDSYAQSSAITQIGQSGPLSQEQFVHIILQRETTIGRALENDLILLDPAVSREHARLVVDKEGWRVYNRAAQNTVLVNGVAVHHGNSFPLQPQDIVQLGNTFVQLVAPQPTGLSEEESLVVSDGIQKLDRFLLLKKDELSNNGNNHHELQNFPLAILRPRSRSQDDRSPANGRAKAGPSFLRLKPIKVDSEQFQDMGIGGRARWMIILSGLAILLLAWIVNSFGGFATFGQMGSSGFWIEIIVPLIPVISISLLVSFIDRFEREPWFLRLAAFLWGALIAILPAVFIEQFMDGIISNWWGVYPNIALHSFLQGLDAGVTEETVKGLGLLLLFVILKDAFDNITDGIIYGTLIGAGFAMVENVVNFVNPRDLFGLIVGRIVLGWFCHSTFTVCLGVALGSIRHAKARRQRILIPLLGYLLAIGLHTGFDFINAFVRNFSFTHPNNVTVGTIMLIAIVCDYIPPFIVQVVILSLLIKSLAQEAAIICEFLASEVTNGIVTIDEYVLLHHPFARLQVKYSIFRYYGIKQLLRVKALYQAEIGLAFRKWHTSMGDKPGNPRQSEDAYRQRIAHLRQEIALAQRRKVPANCSEEKPCWGKQRTR